MPTSTSLRLKRMDDATLIRVFEAAKTAGSQALEEVQRSKKLTGRNPSISIDFKSFLPWEVSKDDLQDVEPGQFVLNRITLSFSIEGPGNNSGGRDSIHFEVSRGGSDDLTDKLTISATSNGPMNNEGAQSIQKAIHKALSVILQPVAPDDGGLVPALTNLALSFDTTYHRIAGELSSAVIAVSKERTQQLTEFQEERKKLRKEISDERENIAKVMNDEIDSERRKIEQEKEKLSDGWKKLEISSHKDARRKQFALMQKDLQDSLNTPVADSGLRRIRWAVFVALLIAGGIAAYFAFLSFDIASWEAAQPKTMVGTMSATVMLTLRSVILTVASLTAFAGAAAWMRYYYNRDMLAQEEIRRFRNDMARASWVMDASMEIRKEHGEIIPPEWISGVTQGLFSKSEKPLHGEGAQALAALLGVSATARFGPNGMQVELSKKGRKIISEAADKT
nr:hypothetical protein [uncultured Cohaesibacter sp.]